jgi:glycolate oxidase subunit GlcD
MQVLLLYLGGPSKVSCVRTYRESRLSQNVQLRLFDILGQDGLIVEPDRLLVYESDALTYIRGNPLGVALPATSDQLAATVRFLHDEGIPFVPRGAATGLSSGAVARDAMLISTVRLNRLIQINPEEAFAIVEPGVIIAEINAAAAPFGLRYLPDPASAAACTIGGNVAENSGGPHCLLHGVTTQHVLQLDVLLPDGTPATLNRGQDGGLDMAGLFIGSEGTLGLATRIKVRLVPLAQAERTALAQFDRLEDAAWAVSAILASGITPVALELIDRETIRMVEDSVFATGMPTDLGAALIVEVEGFPAEVDADIVRVDRVAREAGARDVQVASDAAARLRLWHARKKAFGALGRKAPEVLIQDAVVPRTALAATLDKLREIAARYDLDLVNYFHAGDGNLHPHLLFDHRDQDQVARVEQAGKEMMQVCVEAEGTITGEHGVGLDKKETMRLIFNEIELDALRSVKRVFDPSELCNADKVLPNVVNAE